MYEVTISLPLARLRIFPHHHPRRMDIGVLMIAASTMPGMPTIPHSVMNSLIHTDMSEVIRIIASNGMILYALTRKSEVK